MKPKSVSIVETNSILLAVLTLLNAGGLLWSLRLGQGIHTLGDHIHRAAVHQRELVQLLDSHAQLAELQGRTESLIHGSTTTIRSIHREIANIPFDILNGLPATRDTSRVVRGVHDLTADGVYASITSLNRLMGKRLRRQLKIDDPEDPDDEPDIK